MRIITVLIVVVLCFSCRLKEENIYFKDLDTTYNILNIKRTNFYFENHAIYNVGIPDPNRHALFSLCYFLYEDNDVLKFIFIDKQCIPNYESGIYNVTELTDIPEAGKIDPCYPVIYSLCGFNQSIGDTIKTLDSNSVNLGKFVILEDKFWSQLLADTVYRFYVSILPNSISQRYYISKRKGIVGLANLEYGLISDSLGFPFQNSESELLLDTIDDTVLRNFKNLKIENSLR